LGILIFELLTGRSVGQLVIHLVINQVFLFDILITYKTVL